MESKPRKRVVIIETPSMFYVQHIDRIKHSPLYVARFNKSQSIAQIKQWIKNEPSLQLNK